MKIRTFYGAVIDGNKSLLRNLNIAEAGLEVKKKTERRILDVIWQGPVKVLR
jgi:hypothetical protein